MTSLDNAMEMLIVAQNVIEEQKEKIKMLHYKTRKMKSKITSLERKLVESKHVKSEKKEFGTQTNSEDIDASLDIKCSSTVPLCDLVEKLELSTHPRENDRHFLTPTNSTKVNPHGSQRTDNESTNKIFLNGAIKKISPNQMDFKESIQKPNNTNLISVAHVENQFDSKICGNVKQENILKDLSTSQEDHNFILQNFLDGNEESNENSIFSNENNIEDNRDQKCVPIFNETISESTSTMTNNLTNENEIPAANSNFFFRSLESVSSPYRNMDDAVSVKTENMHDCGKMPREYINDENSSQLRDSGAISVTGYPPLADNTNNKSCDILADFSQTNYNLVNFELLENLSESQMDNMELFNDQELNSPLHLPEISNDKDMPVDSECNNEYFVPPSSPVANVIVETLTDADVSRSLDILNDSQRKKEVKKNKKIKCKKNTRVKIKRNKYSTGANAHKPQISPICNNILNIRSVLSLDDGVTEEIMNFENQQETEQLHCSSQDQADELIRIVEQDQVEFFATDDKDTFIISLNSDMDPGRIKQLLNDGTLSIHVDDSDKHTMEKVSDEEIFFDDINNGNIDHTYINDEDLKENLDRVASSENKSESDENIIFVNGANEYQNYPSAENSNEQDLKNSNSNGLSLLNHQQCSTNHVGANNESNSIARAGQGSENLIEINNAKGILKSKKIFSCQKCKKIFYKKDNYKSHIATHNSRWKRHACETCGERFSWRSSLVRHVSSKHLPPAACNLCPAMFPNQSKIKEHMANKHLKEKKHVCTFPDCGRKFFKKYNLTTHIRTHTKEHLYACSICGTSFGHISHKTRHERTHFTPTPIHGQKLTRYKPPATSFTSSNNNITDL